MTGRIREKIKNAVIALLIMSAAVMFAFLMYSGSGRDSRDASTGGQSVASPTVPYSAALPTQNGYTLLTLERGLKVYFEGARSALSGIFATMSAPEAADGERWSAALGLSPAVFYYGAELPLKVVSDGEASADISFSVMLVLPSGGSTELYFKSSQGVFRAVAEVGCSELFENIPALGWACALARSLPSASSLAPETPVPGSDGSTASATLSYPELSDWAGQIVSSFGGDEYSVRSFFDENGQRVCIVEGGLVYLSSGRIRFTAEEDGIDISLLGIVPSGDELIDAVRTSTAVLSSCISGRAGTVQYLLSGVWQEGGSVTVSMDMLADGIYLLDGSGSRRAAWFEFREGRLYLAELTVAEVKLSYGSGGTALTPAQNAALLLGNAEGRLETVFLPSSGGYERRLCLLER